MNKFIKLDFQGKLQQMKVTLKDKNKFDEYQIFYDSLLEKDIFLEGETFDIDKIFKEKLDADGEHEFLEALINIGFFDE